MRNDGKMQQLNKNAGFSLVEVLVCIAILALISVPIMAGFRTSALYTNHAHKTQKVTAYAQETLETIKSVEVADFEAMILSAVDGEGNPSGTVDKTDVDTTLQAQFTYADGTAYPAEFFTRIVCTQEDIEIDGELYDMEVVFDPSDYSQKKAATENASSYTSANDANVYAVADVDAVNGMLFPVIADEISQYEGTGAEPAAVLYNLRSLLKKNQQSGDVNAEVTEIYQNLTKTIRVTVDETGSEQTVSLGSTNYIKNNLKVNCDVVYESAYNGVALKQIYNVYSGNFELLGRLATDGSGVEEWEKGGDIYLFARAFQDQYFGAALPTANKIEIVNNYSGSGKLDFYLVRGYYYDKDALGQISNQRGLHFDTVTVNGTVYENIPQMTPLSGEWSDGNTRLHTNIKGMITGRALVMPGDAEITVGMEKPTMRCYHVTIRMIEKSSGDEVANIETTKEIR